jgi:uncharacterized membrane protein YecN with MAPEG domain
MEITEIYSLGVGGIAVFLILYRLLILTSYFLYICGRDFFLAHLVYARVYHRISRLRAISRYQLLFQLAYFFGTTVCNLVGVQSISQAGLRAARLALINLVALFFSGSHAFGAHLLGISLQAYRSIHSTVSLMVLAQSVIHTVIALRSIDFSLTHKTHLYGLLVRGLTSPRYFGTNTLGQGSTALLLLLGLPFIRRHLYELF